MSEGFTNFKIRIIGAPGYDIGCPSTPKIWYDSHIGETFFVTKDGTGYRIAEGEFKGKYVFPWDAEIIE